jgi:hypothetical protein
MAASIDRKATAFNPALLSRAYRRRSDGERAIRWLIALMVWCCDPLAIALIAAASASSKRLARAASVDMFVGLDAGWRNPQDRHDRKNDKPEQNFKSSIALQESDRTRAKLRIIDGE